mgnify:CR=1 FL=1
MSFAEVLTAHNRYCDETMRQARNLLSQANAGKEKGNLQESERLVAEAEKITQSVEKTMREFDIEHREDLEALMRVVGDRKVAGLSDIGYNEDAKELYLNAKEQENRRIAFTHCEDEEGCGFLVEFKHPNSTFFFCKEHGTGINLDLNTVSAGGAECELHGKMERYDLLKDDNVCPRCEKTTLAILSVGR